MVGGIRGIVNAQRVVQVSLRAQGLDDRVCEREARQADPRVLAIYNAIRNLFDGTGVRCEQLPANEVAANRPTYEVRCVWVSACIRSRTGSQQRGLPNLDCPSCDCWRPSNEPASAPPARGFGYWGDTRQSHAACDMRQSHEEW